MGFFSKLFKGVKKVFKKIGKGIKSAFKSVGKFMGKLGIVGQIGLGLFMPYLGGMLGNWAVGAMGSSNALVSAAGQFVNAAVNIGTKTGSVFKSVTEGVTSVIGETVGAVANKIGLSKPLSKIGINVADKNFGTVFDAASNAMSDVAASGKNLFSMDTLTGTNKYAKAAMAKIEAQGPNLTDTENVSRIEIPEAPAPQMSALDAGDTTGLVPPTDNIITPDIAEATRLGQLSESERAIRQLDTGISDVGEFKFEVPEVKLPDYNKQTSILARDSIDGESNFVEKLYTKGVEEYEEFIDDPFEGASERLQSAVTTRGLQAVGLEDKPMAPIYNQFATAMPQFDMSSTNIRMSRGIEFDPRAYEANQNFYNLNPIGNSAAMYGMHQEYLNSLNSRVG